MTQSFQDWSAQEHSGGGFSAGKDLLAQLLERNLVVAHSIERDKLVTQPGIAANSPNRETLISEDCIRPPALP